MADAFFEADGVAIGNPAIKAGCKVKIDGRRHQVRRRVHGHARARTPTAARRGYQTHFQISGRSRRTLTELIRPPARARLVGFGSWSAW